MKEKRKKESECRVESIFMCDVEVLEWLEEKGGVFKRGKRGGRSEALNRAVRFCIEYEKEQGGK